MKMKYGCYAYRRDKLEFILIDAIGSETKKCVDYIVINECSKSYFDRNVVVKLVIGNADFLVDHIDNRDAVLPMIFEF